MAVFVLDKRKRPLMPCSEKRARLLLERGRARVHRLHPFTIRLTDRTQEESALQPLALKIDPGSKTTGMALVREDAATATAQVVHHSEVEHKTGIADALKSRSALRRGRRARKTRYRAPRFLNRTRPEGWLAPSLRSRVESVSGWVERYRALAPIARLSLEVARFDTQKMQDPEVAGVAYQQGTLHGYEVWEYLLEKYQRRCVYCDAQQVPLTKDHVIARSKGGSDRVSNLVLACVRCNEQKGNRPVEEFLAHDPERLARIRSTLKTPLRQAAVMNSTRRALTRVLRETGLPVETSTGAQTRFNRTERGLPKTHALDALCVGPSTPGTLRGWDVPVLCIRVRGRGRYPRTLSDCHGFPRAYLARQKQAFGFQSGDRVRAVVPRGKWAGEHVGTVAIRHSGRFAIRSGGKMIAETSHRHCTLLARGDGHEYTLRPRGGAFRPGPTAGVPCAGN
jgi:5-methylcytosine-specific restriction endonuclease McrA